MALGALIAAESAESYKAENGPSQPNQVVPVTTACHEPAVVTKILASQRAITIGSVLGEMRRIFKTQPRIVLGASAGSVSQARDLSLRSRVWPELDRGPLTPFPVGVTGVTTALTLFLSNDRYSCIR